MIPTSLLQHASTGFKVLQDSAINAAVEMMCMIYPWKPAFHGSRHAEAPTAVRAIASFGNAWKQCGGADAPTCTGAGKAACKDAPWGTVTCPPGEHSLVIYSIVELHEGCMRSIPNVIWRV